MMIFFFNNVGVREEGGRGDGEMESGERGEGGKGRGIDGE